MSGPARDGRVVGVRLWVWSFPWCPTSISSLGGFYGGSWACSAPSPLPRVWAPGLRFRPWERGVVVVERVGSRRSPRTVLQYSIVREETSFGRSLEWNKCPVLRVPRGGRCPGGLWECRASQRSDPVRGVWVGIREDRRWRGGVRRPSGSRPGSRRFPWGNRNRGVEWW